MKNNKKAKAPEAKAKKSKKGSRAKKVLLLAAGAALVYLGFFSGNTLKPKSTEDLSKATVMIVRMDHRSGGSGVILKSTPESSSILTNSHVCGVVEKGGLVVTDSGEYAVRTYTRSVTHDLCLITVGADLGVSTSIASAAPRTYSDAAISGHPSLLPTVVTRGHFSGKRQIEVLTGFRKCTDEDAAGDNALLCMFFGGIPTITRYEARLVTATIQPGSSGSAVFTDKGEIGALVFAGSGDLGYAYTVPYEAISFFLNVELPFDQMLLPENSFEISLKGQAENKNRTPNSIVKEIDPASSCRANPSMANENEAIKRICRIVERDLVWRNY